MRIVFFILNFPLPYFFLDKKVTKSQAKKTLVTSLCKLITRRTHFWRALVSSLAFQDAQ